MPPRHLEPLLQVARLFLEFWRDMTLQDRIKEITLANHLGSHFAELVVFTPVDGSQDREITVSIRKRTSKQENDVTQTTQDEYEVLIGRDSSDATRGGVEVLQVNDRIKRSHARDPSDIPLIFTGELTEEHQHSMVGVFVRSKRVAQGKGR